MAAIDNLGVIRGIAQAAANAYDGALDDEGNPIEIGLKREKGHPVLNSRIMDGFKIKIAGPVLVVNYQSDITLKDVYGTDFENGITNLTSDYVAWLKKEYKKITGNSLSLTPVGEPDILVQKTSKIRVFANASTKFMINSLEGVKGIENPNKYEMDKSFKDFVNSGGWKKSR